MNFAKYLNELPVIPDIAQKILEMAQQGMDISFLELEQTISLDPGLTSKVLRVANSALYARQNQISNLRSAITLLGFNNIRNLVLLVTASSMFSKNKKSPFYRYFWKHSLVTAFYSRSLATEAGNPELEEEAFLAGLLHNIGQVALFLSAPEGYEKLITQVVIEGKRLSSLEKEAFDTDHKEVGHSVLEGWNFPSLFSDCALEHGANNITSPHKQLIIIVSTADFLTSNWDGQNHDKNDINLIAGLLPLYRDGWGRVRNAFSGLHRKAPRGQALSGVSGYVRYLGPGI
jgi:HD-like signal output (HDOD) protein